MGKGDKMEKIPESIKKKIWANFDEYRVVYFATVEGDKPRVRPLTVVFLDSKLWVLTGTKDAKTKQLRENKNVEMCLPIEKDENKGYIRFGGKAKIIHDQKIKEDISKKVDYFKNYWKSSDDPTFTLLEIEVEEIEYMDQGKFLAEKYHF